MSLGKPGSVHPLFAGLRPMTHPSNEKLEVSVFLIHENDARSSGWHLAARNINIVFPP